MAEETERPVRKDFSELVPLRVRWAEVDAQQIVFNPHYLTYADIAVTEFMRRMGFPYPEGLTSFGCDLYVVTATIDFHASAAFDDELDLAVRVSHMGRTSVHFLVAIFRGEDLLVVVKLVYVNAGQEVRSPTPLPAAFREKIGQAAPQAS